MKILGLIFLFGLIIFWEVPKMLKDQSWKELGVFSFLMLLAMALSFAQVLGLEVPSPTKGIEYVFSPVSDYVNSLLSD